MKKVIPVSLLGFSLLTSCLTLNVNVNFPESSVQQATDSYVHDLYRQKEKGKPNKSSLNPEQEENPKEKKSTQLEIHFIQSALATEVSSQFKIDSEKAEKIKLKLAEYLPDVLTYKKSGVVGETHDGKLVIRNSESFAGKPLLQKKIEKLVQDENKARDELYQEVIDSNHTSQSHLIDVKKSFARSFQSESPSGTWIQDEAGGWTRK